jgi:two-component sensor histidine kinase/integral membrane sensor domain MASE1
MRNAGIDRSAVTTGPAGEAQPWSRQLTPVVLTIAIAVCYYIAARLSLLLQIQPENIAVFWPAAGLAAGALVALGPRARWPVVIAVLTATAAANLEHGSSVLTALVFGLCNALESVLVAGLLHLLFGRPFRLDSLAAVLGFLVATLAGAALAAFPAALYLANIAGSPAPAVKLWQVWVQSDAVGIVTVAPVLIALPSTLRERLPAWRWLEAAAILALIAATASYVFVHLPAQASWSTVAPVAFLFPLLLWLAVRGTPIFAAAGAFVVALAIVYCVTEGLGALGSRETPLYERVFVAQVAMLTLSFCTLVLSAQVAGLRSASAALQASEQRLRIATQAARLGVFELRLVEDRAVWENERMYELFAHSRADGTLSYIDFRDGYVDAADKERVEQAMQRALVTGQGAVQCRIRRKDGVSRELDIVGIVNRSEAGTPDKMIGVMADITEQRRSEERQSLLMSELDHRVKNTFDVVTRLLESTHAGAGSKDELAGSLKARLDALVRAHQLLRLEHWSGVDLGALVRGLLEPYAEGSRVSIAGPAVKLDHRATQTFCMALHELATNAAKYGGLSTDDGRVAVSWRIEPANGAGQTLLVDWRETGGPLVAPPIRTGFGTRLIRGAIQHEQQGRVDIDYEPGGLVCRISVPLENVTGEVAPAQTTRSSDTPRTSISNSRSTTGGRQ